MGLRAPCGFPREEWQGPMDDESPQVNCVVNLHCFHGGLNPSVGVSICLELVSLGCGF